MECKRCLISTDIPGINFVDGLCDFCRVHDHLEAESQKFNLWGFVDQLKKTKNKYHCLIGISGGLDSSFMLEYTVKTLGLNPLVIHFDNWWNVPEADMNMDIMVKALNVDFIRYHVNKSLYDEVCKSLLFASVPDADIANDMVMAELMVRTAKMYKIKYVFNGHDFRHEGSSPLAWTYMDALYVKSVYKWHTGKELKNFPMIGFWGQMFQRTKQVRLLYFVDYNPVREKKRLSAIYGWQDYGAKHSENVYTWFVGAHLLPVKFGIDKRITYLSARIRSGEISKEDAMDLLNLPMEPDYTDEVLAELDITNDEFSEGIMSAEIRSHNHFKTYHSMFIRYRWILWILMKMKVIPYLFFKKYCHEM